MDLGGRATQDAKAEMSKEGVLKVQTCSSTLMDGPTPDGQERKAWCTQISYL
ncbi:hypothetical protein [Psychrosphaera saromensis]|uniref:hypothetical protein n=1 Tax=Psychrosphaera saromensis TaxID=716813 RepID=UPI00167C3FE4|nr:hypothetical protein [Psychrosphaera saromensis]